MHNLNCSITCPHVYLCAILHTGILHSKTVFSAGIKSHRLNFYHIRKNVLRKYLNFIVLPYSDYKIVMRRKDIIKHVNKYQLVFKDYSAHPRLCCRPGRCFWHQLTRSTQGLTHCTFHFESLKTHVHASVVGIESVSFCHVTHVKWT
jgi:hypothetical protein